MDGRKDVREEVFFRFAEHRLPIVAMNYEEVTLEKVFLELTGDTKDAGADDGMLNAGEILSAVSFAGTDAAPAEKPAEKQTEEPDEKANDKKSDDGDYKPLFGGN